MRITYLYQTILIVSIIVFFSSCKKNNDDEKLKIIYPKADFKTDKDIYLSGDTIRLYDRSSNCNKYEWTLPDGSKSKNQYVVYFLGELYAGEKKRIFLKVTSTDGVTTDTISKVISATTQTANVTFWEQPNTFGNVTVKVGNRTSYISGTYLSQPNCNATKCAYFENVTFGKHNYTIENGTFSRSNHFSINSTTCSLLLIY